MTKATKKNITHEIDADNHNTVKNIKRNQIKNAFNVITSMNRCVAYELNIFDGLVSTTYGSFVLINNKSFLKIPKLFFLLFVKIL